MRLAAFSNKLRQLLLNIAMLQMTALSIGIGSLAVQLPGKLTSAVTWVLRYNILSLGFSITSVWLQQMLEFIHVS